MKEACYGLLFLAAGCSPSTTHFQEPPTVRTPPVAPRPTSPEGKVLASLQDQLTWGTAYDPAYVQLKYPGGDLPKEKGVCTDVVIRAYRAAGYDLQKLIHEDARANIRSYPRIGTTAKLDRNIDHRRCPNLVSYFNRHAERPAEWLPGDIVFWKFDSGLDHVGIVSDQVSAAGKHLVVHNIGGTRQDDSLNTWKIVGHYRWQPWRKK